MQIKITKKSDEMTYRKQTDTITFDVNGKTVRVYTFSSTDTDEVMDSEPYEIEEEDYKLLTDIEREAIDEDLMGLLALGNGESLDFDYE